MILNLNLCIKLIYFKIQIFNNVIKLIKSKETIYFSGVGKSGHIAKNASDVLKSGFKSYFIDILNSLRRYRLY